MNVALLGFGLAGSVFHAPLIATTPGLSLAAVVTSDPQRQEQVRQEYPETRILDKSDQIWAHPDLYDLVVLATPNAFHAPLAARAMECGLHVVVDKPMATSLEQARDMVALAARYRRILAVFHNRRWDGDFLTLRQIVQEGCIGPTTRLESRFERWRPAPRQGAWREVTPPEEGGGLLLDLGSHLVDQALVLFGRPSRVYAEVKLRRLGVIVEDDVFIALDFEQGPSAHLWASAVARLPGPRFLLRGLGGSYLKYGLDPQEEALRLGKRPTLNGWGTEAPQDWGCLAVDWNGLQSETPRETVAGDYPAYYRQMELCLRQGAPPPVTMHEALEVMEVLQAARRSAEEGTVVGLREKQELPGYSQT